MAIISVNNNLVSQPSDNLIGSDDNIILSVEDVSKKFCRDLKRAMFYAISDIGGELLGLRNSERTLRKEEFWALHNISFNLKKGDAIGLVGANGAGKTTLLKIISGLIKPDKGQVLVKGRLAPLIALGAGFNPILTGRENVYINMSILGLSHKEINERFDEVVEFSEIGYAIDAPVQTYSSGMSARLGFSCAIHTNPDILLIDEVLAVGDMKFRAKCYRKLADFRMKGASFLLVSHSAQSLLAICQTGVLLKNGRIISSGKIEVVINEYDNSLIHDIPSNQFKPNADSPLYIENIITGTEGQNYFLYGQASSIKFILKSREVFENLKMMLIFRSSSLESDYMLQLDSSKDGMPFHINTGINEIVLSLPECGLKAGTYFLKAAIVGEGHYVYDAVESFQVIVKNFTEDVNSLFFQRRTWTKIL